MQAGVEELAGPALREAAASGLDLAELPGNSAKVRLILDLARQVAAAGGTSRVLDVGAGGRHVPFNLWQPFLPYAGRIELSGIDLGHLDETRARAAELGFPVDLRQAGVGSAAELFGRDAFDAVASTQVLEYLPDWREGISRMADVLRPGGTLYVTCASGDYRGPPMLRVKLRGKRVYAQATRRLPLLRVGRLSGEWEAAPTLAAVRTHVEALGLEVQALRHYGLSDLKDVQVRLPASGRLMSLALEEALVPGDPGLYRLIYLRALKPAAR